LFANCAIPHNAHAICLADSLASICPPKISHTGKNVANMLD